MSCNLAFQHGYYENEEVKELIRRHNVSTSNQKKHFMAKVLGKVLSLKNDLEDEENAKQEDKKPEAEE